MNAANRDFAAGQAGNASRSKAFASLFSAVVLSLLFLASGLWKLSDIASTAERITQLLVPAALSMPLAVLVAASETLTGILLLLPSCRRWGAWLAALLLAAFMAYMAIFYGRLLGEDCSCFPWIRRVVGPGFFAGDAAMLVFALVAGLWSQRARAWRAAAAALAAVILLVAGAFAASVMRRAQADSPPTAIVDGRPVLLRHGHVLLYFFDPGCMTCLKVARKMAAWDWGATRVVVLPTSEPEFARTFLNDSGLRAGICLETDRLKQAFPFASPPYAVTLDEGRLAATFNSGQLEAEEFLAGLKRLGIL